MKNLKINIATGIVGILNCVLFAVSWPVIFGAAVSDGFAGTNVTSGTGAFFYVMAGIGLVLNIISLIQSKKVGISLVGPILGIIANAMFLISAIMAFPSIVVLIVGVVFIFMHHPGKNGYVMNNQNHSQYNYSNQRNQYQNTNNQNQYVNQQNQYSGNTRYQQGNQSYGYGNQSNQYNGNQGYNGQQAGQNVNNGNTRMSRRNR